MTLTDEGVDDHSDTYENATPLIVDGPAFAGEIETRGDTDWFSFEAVAGRTYRVESTGVSTQKVVYSPEPITSLVNTTNASFTFTTSQTGRHYLRVRHSSTTGTGAYTIRVTD